MMTLGLVIFILSALAFQVFPVSLGTNGREEMSKSLTVILALIISQALMFWLGIFIGKRFLHLTLGFENIIVFIILFLIGIRITMESFSVRKGERTFNSDNHQSIILASMAQSINTFLAGLLFYFFQFTELFLVGILLISAFIFSVVGSLVNLNKQSLSFSSFIYLLGGLGLIIASIYLGFFIDF
jgi:putative Mn2+ efflux pump MntP